MRDMLLQYPFSVESGIVNFNTSSQPGSHWVCYYWNKNKRIYFDSYVQITPLEIQRYLKTGSEFDHGKEVIQRNTDIVQAAITSVCGHLWLVMLKSLTNGGEFQSILNHMQHCWISKRRKITFKPKNGFVLPRHSFTVPYNPLHLQLDPQDNPFPGNEPYVVDDISMCHDLGYRDNPAGKHECDHKNVSRIECTSSKGKA